MEFCGKVTPYLVHYIETIQVAANSYLFFSPTPERERKEKKTNNVDVGQNLLLLNNESAKSFNTDNKFFTYLSYVARLCK